MPLSSSISTRVQYQHKSLVEIIDELSEEQIRRNVIPGKWSIFENIVHLQTYQHVFCARLKQILNEVDPVFPRYTAEGDPAFLDNCHKATREVMHDYITTRKELSNYVISITEKDLERNGIHLFFGRMNLIQWLNFFLLHEAHHFFTIFKLTAELKKITNSSSQ